MVAQLALFSWGTSRYLSSGAGGKQSGRTNEKVTGCRTRPISVATRSTSWFVLRSAVISQMLRDPLALSKHATRVLYFASISGATVHARLRPYDEKVFRASSYSAAFPAAA